MFDIIDTICVRCTIAFLLLHTASREMYKISHGDCYFDNERTSILTKRYKRYKMNDSKASRIGAMLSGAKRMVF